MFLAGLLAVCISPSYSASVGASPATYNGTLLYSTIGGQTFIRPNTPGSYSLGEESLSMGGLPQATLEGTASSTAPGPGVSSTGSFGGANMSYYFMYLGSSNTTIPIVIQALLDVSLTGSSLNTGNAQSGVTLRLNGGDITGNLVDCNLALGCSSATYNTPIHVDILSNTEYEINMHIAWQVDRGNTAHVLADPMISIDPLFAGDPSQFLLLQSPGVGNGADAPEPGTMGLMTVAAAGLFFIRRRA